LGYFETSGTNLADGSGDYTGTTVFVSGAVNSALIHRTSSSAVGTWTIEKFNGIGYDVIANPVPGIESGLSENMSEGDEYRVLFNGANGTELYGYEISLRFDADLDSSSSTHAMTSSSNSI
jgi:hypothetical protein